MRPAPERVPAGAVLETATVPLKLDAAMACVTTSVEVSAEATAVVLPAVVSVAASLAGTTGLLLRASVSEASCPPVAAVPVVGEDTLAVVDVSDEPLTDWVTSLPAGPPPAEPPPQPETTAVRATSRLDR